MRILSNNRQDYFFIIAPFWIFLSYPALILLVGEKYSIWVFILYFLLLGETHFGATWLFYTKKENRIWVKRNIRTTITIPTILILGYVVIGIKSVNLAVYIGSAVSFYHVCRQSVGVMKMFCKSVDLKDQIMIFFPSALFLGAGYLRFFVDETLWVNRTIILISLLAIMMATAHLVRARKRDDYKYFLPTYLTGIMIFSPYAFMPSTRDALAMGVGMHWCQYIALTGKIYILKRADSYKVLKVTGLLCYSVITTYLLVKNNQGYNSTNPIVLLPLALHLFHFYLDAFIWKFSDPDIRANIGVPLKAEMNG
jgi:hypothetical protein